MLPGDKANTNELSTELEKLRLRVTELENQTTELTRANSALFQDRQRAEQHAAQLVEVSKAQLEAALTLAQGHEQVLKSATQSEALARSAEKRFQSVVEAVPNGIVMIDSEGRIVLVNAQTEKMFGYRRDEMLSQPVELLVPERFRDRHPDSRVGFLANPVVRAMGAGRELHGRRKDGSEFPVEIGLNPVSTEQGVFVLGAIVDITERKSAEESQLRLAAIVESSVDAIIGESLEGLITSWNGGAERIFLYSAEEVLGRHISILHPPTLREDVAQILSRICRGERLDHFETLRRRKDGQDVVLSLTVSPIYDTSGKIIGASKIARDITESKRLKWELRKHAGFLNQSYDAALAWHPSGGIEFWNRGAQDLYGYAPEEAIGHTSHELLRTVFPAGMTHVELERELTEKGRWEGELTHTAKDGRVLVVDSRMRVTEVSGTQLILEVNRDITERRQAEERLRRMTEDLEDRVAERTTQLEAANKELEAFCYSVSHDLRAPLRAIDGFARILLEDFKAALPDDGQEYLQLVRDNTRQMGRLVDDLLAFSRLSRQVLRKQSITPTRLVRQCLEELRSEQEGRHVEITVGELPNCEADASLLKQVWFNLLANAIKYTRKRDPARIEIGSSRKDRQGGSVYFVKDNGVGFDMRYGHKLFGVFQRLHRAEDYEGTGVGLAIVQRVVHRHGGRVWAEAEPDKGAAFFFTLESELAHE